MDEAKVMNNQCGKIWLHQHCLQGAGIEGRYCGGLIKTDLGSDDICNVTPHLLICLRNIIGPEIPHTFLYVGYETCWKETTTASDNIIKWKPNKQTKIIILKEDNINGGANMGGLWIL